MAIDTEYQDKVLCPKCGYVQCERCEYEMFYRDSDVHEDRECDNEDCDAVFTIVRHVSLSYSTKLTGPKGAE